MSTTNPTVSQVSSFKSFRNRVFFALCVALPLTLLDKFDGVPFLGNIDDRLRALQVRGLVEGGPWFDRTLPFIEMPEAYVSPWSRLVDLPYALIGWALAPFVGMDMALQVAFNVWPLVLLVMFCVLVVKTLIEITGDDETKLSHVLVMASVFLMGLALWEFTPSRTDHHNVQLVLIMMVFCGLSLWSRRGGILAGIGVVLSVVVGLELLPLIACILAAVSLSWIFKRQGARDFALPFGITIAIAAPVASLLFIGPAEMMSTQCDAISAPFIIALVGYGAITAVSAVFLDRNNWLIRGSVLTLAGAVLMALLAVNFSACLAGPYQMIDPISREFWLERIGQEHSALLFFRNGEIDKIVMVALPLMLLVLAAPVVWLDMKRGRTGVAIIFLVSVVAMGLTLYQTRHARFPAAFAPLFLPLAMGFISQHKNKGLLFFGAVSAVIVCGIFGLRAALLEEPRDFDSADYLSFGYCPDSDPSILASVPPGRIMVPGGLGLELAKSLPKGMSIAGLPFHRSSPGMRRILQVFYLRDSEARKKAIAPFDYLVVCRLPIPDTGEADNLFTVVSRGGEWPGLERVEPEKPNNLQLFRIDHAKFQ